MQMEIAVSNTQWYNLQDYNIYLHTRIPFYTVKGSRRNLNGIIIISGIE
jgi:hypothetical protein